MKLPKPATAGFLIAGALSYLFFLGGTAMAGILLGLIADCQSENRTLPLVWLTGVAGASLGIGISRLPASALIGGDPILLVGMTAMLISAPLFVTFLLVRALSPK
ncbi:MAG: hypothetical protein IT406_03630 [Candidatus Yanofskybacteria bacterium]|nr:hypothetical protein [Candidatus Yanofskybacteria bacterium]